jgi:hypothetical protein
LQPAPFVLWAFVMLSAQVLQEHAFQVLTLTLFWHLAYEKLMIIVGTRLRLALVESVA